jgi:hypothetical protein
VVWAAKEVIRHEFGHDVHVLLLLLVAVIAGCVVYMAVADRRIRREAGRRVGTADVPVGAEPDERAADATERMALVAARVLLEDERYDYSPRKTSDVLELPSRLPDSAREAL